MYHYFCLSCYVFFFDDTATTEIYTLSLHDALPIYGFLAVVRDDHVLESELRQQALDDDLVGRVVFRGLLAQLGRSEEHTSELQSHSDLVCRLLLEKKKTKA